ncbi:MAG: polysaccharide biosynthesis tyrosine autokinase [Candidatus Methylomirabilales bacterium]
MPQSSRTSRTDAEPDVDYIQILQGVLRRRKRVVIAAFGLIAVPLLGWSMYGQRPQFQSTATVQIRPSVAEIFPGARDLPVRSDMLVQMAVLRSRSLAKEVLESVPQETVDELMKENLEWDYLLAFSNAARWLLGKPPITVSPRERAMAELQGARMTFRPVNPMNPGDERGGSGLVAISATAFNSRVAADLANAYIQVLVDWSRRSEREDAAATQRFLKSQLNQVRTDLAETETALLKVHEEPSDNPVVSDIHVTVEGAQKLSARLVQLEPVLLEMQAKYTKDHPSLIAVRREIQSLRSQLAQFPKSRMRESEGSRLRGSVESNRALLSFFSEKLVALRIRGQIYGSDVKVIDPPNVPSAPVEPISLRKLAFLLAFALGGAGGLGFLIEYIYEPVESEKTIRRRVDLPFLGLALKVQLPRLKQGAVPRPLLVFNEAHRATMPREFYRTIRTNLEAAKLRTPFKAIMITSACPGEGKSTTAINLAATLRELGYRVALVDADLRKPSLNRILPSGTQRGVAQLLQGSQGFDTVARSMAASLDGMGARRGSDFAFIPSGDSIDDPAAILSSARAREFVGWLKEHWDYVLFDSPPVLLVRDNVLFATSLDGVILVAKAGQTTRRDLLRAKELLEEGGARILGVILNEVSPGQLPYYYHRYRSYYAPLVRREPREKVGARK